MEPESTDFVVQNCAGMLSKKCSGQEFYRDKICINAGRGDDEAGVQPADEVEREASEIHELHSIGWGEGVVIILETVL